MPSPKGREGESLAKKNTNSSQPEKDAGLPAALDVERSVLGAVFLVDLAYHELVAAGLKREDFSSESNRKIFGAMQLLVQARSPLDSITLCNQLEKNGELEAVGNVAYLSHLVDGVPDRGPNLRQYVDILKEKTARRQVIHLANRVAASSMDPSDPIKWTIAGMHDDLLRMQGDTQDDGMLIKDFSMDVLEEIRTLMYAEREIIGLPFGIAELDEVTTGMRDGELTVVGGYPGQAKTSFAIDVARKNAASGVPSAIFSVEMKKQELLPRLWAQESGISYAKLRNPHHLASSELRELDDTWKPRVDKYPIIIDDRAKDIREIVPRAHLYIRRHGAKLIVVDFLQIVDAPGEKEYEKVSYTIDALRDLGKETRVPIMVVSQLTRPDEKKKSVNIPPNMMQLRSSGKIEQNSHLVLLMYRPEDANGDPTGEDLIIIGKQRAGVKGRVKAFFDGRSQTWTERVESAPDPQAKIFDDKKQKSK